MYPHHPAVTPFQVKKTPRLAFLSAMGLLSILLLVYIYHLYAWGITWIITCFYMIVVPVVVVATTYNNVAAAHLPSSEPLKSIFDPHSRGLCPIGVDGDPRSSLYFEKHGSGPEKVLFIMG